jgi:hypothetical protein
MKQARGVVSPQGKEEAGMHAAAEAAPKFLSVHATVRTLTSSTSSGNKSSGMCVGISAAAQAGADPLAADLSRWRQLSFVGSGAVARR